jgi:hypothetical protein
MRSLRTSVRERTTRRDRLTNGLRRITGRPRKLSAEEIRAHEQRLRNDGILPRVNERI